MNPLATRPGRPLLPIKVGWPPTGLLPAMPICSKLVIFGPFIRVAKHLVGFVNLLEASFGLGIIGIDIGMMPAG